MPYQALKIFYQNCTVMSDEKLTSLNLLSSPASMVGGDFMSVYYSSDHRGYYSPRENVGRHAQLSCATPTKWKFDYVCNTEVLYSAQKKVSPAVLKHMVRKRTSLTPLNKQMSPCAPEDGLQSSSCQTNQPFKTVKCDVLKDMSNILRDTIKK